MKSTSLYREMVRRMAEIPQPPANLLEQFHLLVHELDQQGKYILSVFPEYTPHDPTLHLQHLFPLADELLGLDLYAKLNAAELLLLCWALYAHDWGMAVSDEERSVLENQSIPPAHIALLTNEPSAFQEHVRTAAPNWKPDNVWTDYLRKTHGLRSGARLRHRFRQISVPFAEALGRLAEGHTLSARDIRDLEKYPHTFAVFGQPTNLAALAEYVRIVDLLDIGDNRTPYALWKFVQPRNPTSAMEWQKHRALSPVAVERNGAFRRIHISGVTHDTGVFAALHDLRAWVDLDFAASIAHLRNIGGHYDLAVDSPPNWKIQTVGFEPLLTRFECDRETLLGLLAKDLYGGDPHSFIRELLQNSVDAIDARQALLASHGLTSEGAISVALTTENGFLTIRWMDNGIGMDQHIIEHFLARAGRSWYQSPEFARTVPGVDPLSRFGIGLLSCFAVADGLQIRTRKEPHAAGDATGYIIDIPTPYAHFRIAKVSHVPVGTEVRLDTRISTPQLAAHPIIESLKRIALYVRHSITVSMEGEIIRISSLSGAASWPSEETSPELQILARDDLRDALASVATTHTFYFGGTAAGYEGHYSALFPKQPARMTQPAQYTWDFDGTVIDFEEFPLVGSDHLFVKGVMVGLPSAPVGRWGVGPGTGAHHHSDWIGPKIGLNLHRPSQIEFNLARSEAKITTPSLIEAAWTEIARRLRDTVFATSTSTLEDRARTLGVAAVCGGLPYRMLTEIVAAELLPVPVLRGGSGVVWEELGRLVATDEFMEAPHEVRYVFSHSSPFTTDPPALALRRWEGADALMTLDVHTIRRQAPMLTTAASLWPLQLRRLGFLPTRIEAVASGAADTLPLVCRVWTRNSPASLAERVRHPELRKLAGNMSDQPLPFLMSLVLGREPPDLVEFPLDIKHLAAFGSCFWNIEHEKVAAIVAALVRLALKVRRGEASLRTRERFHYLVSTRYLGYVVPSRRSGKRLAVTVHEELFELCQQEGVAGDASPLKVEDFVPGSIGKYVSPYHYDLSGWSHSGSRPGAHRGR